MEWALYSWAFLAGAAATVNPCGVAMLPAYISYYLGNEEGHVNPLRGLQAGLLLAGGVLTVFASMGIIVAGVGSAITQSVPWLALLIGVSLLVAGVATLADRAPALSIPGAQQAPRDRSGFSFFTFGIAYGVASLGCTLPIFMIVVSSVLSAGFPRGLSAFMAYGLGMGAVLTAISLAVALGKTAIVRSLRSASGPLKYVGGFGLLLAGGYLIYYNLSGLQLFFTGQKSALPLYAGVSMFVLSLLAAITLKRVGGSERQLT
jgi:cytochrome c-type biogenesis protein